MSKDKMKETIDIMNKLYRYYIDDDGLSDEQIELLKKYFETYSDVSGIKDVIYFGFLDTLKFMDNPVLYYNSFYRDENEKPLIDNDENKDESLERIRNKDEQFDEYQKKFIKLLLSLKKRYYEKNKIPDSDKENSIFDV